VSTNRRTFLRNAAAVGITAPAAASLLGLTVWDPAEAAPSDELPDYAPVLYSHSHAEHIGAAAIPTSAAISGVSAPAPTSGFSGSTSRTSSPAPSRR